jgi:Polyribonucleotide nucleotidyltransferase (polynucleotide phosphorylase)
MSHHENVMPDPLVGLAASAPLSLSDIPFDSPISKVRVPTIDAKFLINPSKTQLEESDIDIMVGASENSIVMVERDFNDISY